MSSPSTLSVSLEDIIATLSVTNEPPGDEVVGAIRNEVPALSQSISALDDEIRRLKSQVAMLEDSRAATQRKLDKAKDVLSPFRRCPPELLGEILAGSLPAVMNGVGRRSFYKLRTVCRSWRRVALSTPALWANLSIDVSEVPGRGQRATRSREPSARRIRAWFDRAPTESPLTFTITNQHNVSDDYHSEAALEKLRDIYFVALDDRNWSTVGLSASPALEEVLRPLYLLVAKADYAPWRNLKSLDLYLPVVTPSGNGDTTEASEDDWPFQTPPFEFWWPSLEELRLTSCATETPLALWHISHPRVHTLELEVRCPFSAVSFMEIVKKFPNLLNLSIRGSDYPFIHSYANPVVHPRIRKLVLQGSHVSNALRYLSLPALQQLELDGLGHWNSYNNNTLLGLLLNRSGCRLKRLSVDHAWLRDEVSVNRALREPAASSYEALECLSFSTGWLYKQLGYKWYHSGDEKYDPLLFPAIRTMTVYGSVPKVPLHLLVQYFEDRKAALEVREGYMGALLPITLDFHKHPEQKTLSMDRWNQEKEKRHLERLMELGVRVFVEGVAMN